MTFSVAKEELRITFARSGGPGGQNVNRRETKVVVKWDYGSSNLISDDQKEMIRTGLAGRINSRGELVVTCDETRHQERNLAAAVLLLNELVNSAIERRPRRVPTRPPKRAREERLKTKKIRSMKKKLRGGLTSSDICDMY